ncbi:hypothetical protein DPM19_21355 [Actinomadura craniellae]|uniref:Phosphatidic acid phosphatase type 2/haloperoxidase domain-containing protein n=1 Tax=Actinomadura craniellae TaxID=2231787 RepID=A0A365H1S3_9ACTN|nr:phosphatase PAP2 family protein [Actinomadura craniellae]RAY13054.1 hypothetical protein DPM19_21355 [Actinomadura craniellae]
MLTHFMHAVSFLGSAAFYVPVFVVLLWCVRPRFGAGALVTVLLGSALNALLQLSLQDPRPYWTDRDVTALEAQTSFGMPSGHAQGAMIAWGYLAARWPFGARLRPWATGTAVVLVLLVGVSRVYLGQHTPEQVAAGWTTGALLLAAVLWSEPRVLAWWRARPLTTQFGLVAGVAAAFLAPAALTVRWLEGWQMPAAWRQAIVAAGGTGGPVTADRCALATGTLCGALVGLSWLYRRGGFAAAGPPARRLLRLPVGLAGSLAAGTFVLLPGPEPVLIFCAQALVGLWFTAGAPETFRHLRLAAPAVPPAPAPERAPV